MVFFDIVLIPSLLIFFSIYSFLLCNDREGRNKQIAYDIETKWNTIMTIMQSDVRTECIQAWIYGSRTTSLKCKANTPKNVFDRTLISILLSLLMDHQRGGFIDVPWQQQLRALFWVIIPPIIVLCFGWSNLFLPFVGVTLICAICYTNRYLIFIMHLKRYLAS